MSEDPEAPGGLGLIEAFVNSAELPDGDDALSTTAGAARWLEAHGVTASTVTEPERRGLVELREALRDLLEGNSGREVAVETQRLVMHRLNAGALAAVISPDGAALVPAGSGVSAFLGQLTAAMVAATVHGTWRRLKVCSNGECRWAFYDATRNACRTWCSMRSCGCQSKARAYRARKREQSLAPAG